MQNHVKPTILDINPQQIIYQVGINDLKTEQTASQIAKSIIDLSISFNILWMIVDSSFPRTQFHIHGFREPYRFDINGKGGGILLYMRDYIPIKLESKMTI